MNKCVKEKLELYRKKRDGSYRNTNRRWLSRQMDRLCESLISYEKPLCWTHFMLKWLFWALLMLTAYRLGLTAGFLLMSALYALYASTGNNRTEKELSAYSVFNPNCMSIQGTLKLEQLERELGYKV